MTDPTPKPSAVTFERKLENAPDEILEEASFAIDFGLDDGRTITQSQYFTYGEDFVIAVGELNLPNCWSDAEFAEVIGELQTRLSNQASHAAEVDRLRADAEKWQALMDCQRIRLFGHSGASEDGHINHMTVEFWHEHPARHPSVEFPQDESRALFERFASTATGDRHE